MVAMAAMGAMEKMWVRGELWKVGEEVDGSGLKAGGRRASGLKQGTELVLALRVAAYLYSLVVSILTFSY